MKDNSVVYIRAQCEVQAVAEAPREIQERTKDNSSVLPRSMQKSLTASMKRNREAFERLSRL
ncbi:MAG: hypothetical protein ABR985_05580 [Methanotrichaceae archaeon]